MDETSSRIATEVEYLGAYREAFHEFRNKLLRDAQDTDLLSVHREVALRYYHAAFDAYVGLEDRYHPLPPKTP